jgi:hypothetical protein
MAGVEQVCSIGDSKYLVASEVVGLISIPNDCFNRNPSLPLPATIIRIDGLQSVTLSWLQKTIDEMLASDDVLCKEFLSFILFQCRSRGTPPKIIDEAWARLKGGSAFCTGDLPSGPYVLSSSGCHKVFKLCPDTCGAFMYGIVESENSLGRFEMLASRRFPY